MDEFKEEQQAVVGAWEKCKETEKHGLEFGKACYEYKKKLEASGSPLTISAAMGELGVPVSAATRWIPAYMEASNIKIVRREKRMNRSLPPDDFEVLRKLAKQMLNAGFEQLKTKSQTDPSHLDAAKRWALIKIEEKEKKPITFED